MKAMNQTIADLRASVLLSIQRALLGVVSPSLRGVTVGWGEKQIRIICYFHGPVSDEDREALGCAHSEIIADFPDDYNVDLEIIREDSPLELLPLQAWAYLRRE